jgi:MATE family multidrug resistance protein
MNRNSEEISKIMKLSTLISLSTLMMVGLFTTDVMFMDEKEFTTITMAQAWRKICTSIVIPSASILYTLESQASGANNYHLIGQWIQVALTMTIMFLFICIPTLFLTSTMLNLFECNSQSQHESQIYNMYYIIGIIPLHLFMVLSNFCQGIELIWPTALVSTFGFVVNIVFNFLMYPEWGIDGISVATSISVSLTVILFVIIVFSCMKFHLPYWPGWPISSWYRSLTHVGRVREYATIVFPLMLSLLFRTVGTSFITMLGGKLSSSETDAIAIFAHISELGWAVCSGIGAALQIRVGYHMGCGESESAKESAKNAVICATGVILIVYPLLWIFKSDIPHLFTENASVIILLEQNMGIICIILMVSCLSRVVESIFVAMTYTKSIAIVNGVATWVFNIPISLFFGIYYDTFYNSKIEGLFLGSFCSNLLMLILYCIMLV